MTYQSNPQHSGFRELSPQELEAVSGGDGDGHIIVTGSKPTFTPDYAGYLGMNLGLTGFFNQGYDIYEPAGGDDTVDPSNPDEPGVDPKAVKEGADALIAQLKDLQDKYGPFNVKLPDGTIVSVGKLLDGLGKVSAAADVGVLALDALNGDLDVGAVAGFLVGIGVAAALPASTPAVAAFVATSLATKATEIAVNSFIQYADQRLNEIASEMAQQSQNANPNTTPGIAFWEWLANQLNPSPNPPEFYDDYRSDSNTHMY